jgi:tRNA pseudouridine55 synthase
MKQFNDLNGVLLLDKPSGITSNRALQMVKHLFNAKGIKVGHTGSLDPLATGMLPICFGEAAKFSSFLLNSDKRYLVTMQLGLKTDTGDLDGAIIATDDSIKNKYFDQSAINQVLKQFIGKISQIPPIYSAIKQNGVRLYKIARSIKQQSACIENRQIDPKINITLLPRIITIHEIKLLNICNTKKQISLEVFVAKVPILDL